MDAAAEAMSLTPSIAATYAVMGWRRAAILAIGLVGMVLDLMLAQLTKMVTFPE